MDLEKELWVLHEELGHSGIRPYITQKQVRALAILMGKCIQEKRSKIKKQIRIYALDRIAGDAVWKVANVENLTSTKNLTGTMAKILLDLFLEDEESWKPSDYAKRLIGALESEYKEKFGSGESNPDPTGVAA